MENQRKALMLQRFSSTIARAALKLHQTTLAAPAPAVSYCKPPACYLSNKRPASDIIIPCRRPVKKQQHLSVDRFSKKDVVCAVPSPKKSSRPPPPPPKQLSTKPAHIKLQHLSSAPAAKSKVVMSCAAAPPPRPKQVHSVHPKKPARQQELIFPASSPVMPTVPLSPLSESMQSLRADIIMPPLLSPFPESLDLLAQASEPPCCPMQTTTMTTPATATCHKRMPATQQLTRDQLPAIAPVSDSCMKSGVQQIKHPQQEQAPKRCPKNKVLQQLRAASLHHEPRGHDQLDLRAALDAARKAVQEKTQSKQRRRGQAEREEARAALEAVEAGASAIDDACQITEDFCQLLSSTSCFSQYAGGVPVECTYASNMDCAGRLRINFLVC